jgi:PAS domain S-box-containing protein
LKKTISLRWFLSLNLGLALVVQCVVVAVLAWHILLPQMRADIGFHQHAMAHAVAGDVSAHVLGGERQLRALAEFIGTHPDLPEISWNDLLDAQCGDGDMFEAIYLTDCHAKEIQATGLAHGLRARRQEVMGRALSEVGCFQQTTPSAGLTFWSDPFSSTASGCMAVALTIALGKQAITGVITIDRLSEWVRNVAAGTEVQALILDRRGLIIADSKEIWRGRPFDAQQFPEVRGLHDAPCIPTAFSLHGRSLVGTLTAIDPIGWKVVVAQHSRAAYQPIWSTFLTIGLGLLIAVLLALLFAWFQSTKLVRLFKIYSDQARAISQGHYDVHRPEARTREFAQLAETMQQMAQMIRQREQRIVDSESNLKITLDSIRDAVVATDDQGRVVRMNPSAERLAGRPLAEAAGKPLIEIFSIIDGHSRQQTVNPLAQVLAHGHTVALGNDTLLLPRAGGERRVAVSAAPIRSLEQRIVGAVMVLRDVTEMYAKEQQIRESERLLKNLTANVPLVVYQIHVKPGGVFSLDVVNPQVSNILGLEVATEEILAAFIARIPEEEKEALLSSVRTAIDTVSPWHWEGRYHKSARETIWFTGDAICQQQGAQIVFYGFLMDTTERKQWESALRESERRFKDLFNEAPVMYVITENRDMVPYVRDVNNLFLGTLGYHRAEVIGTPLSSFYTDVSRYDVFENGGYQRALRGEHLTEERGLVTRDGRTIHTLLHTRPEYDPAGRVIGTRAMFLDITRRKRAEQESERLASALLQAQKMEAIGTLAGGIAHDFNNILSAVIGYADLSIKEVEKHSRLHINLEQILVAGLRARDLVQQILAFSRQEERELRPLQVAPLVKEALKLLRSSLPSTIEIRQQIAPRLDNVLADPTQIHRVIINLCTNAAHAMEENGGVLTVSLAQVTLTDQDVRLHPGLRPATYLKLSVQDTGRGIAPEYLTKIFDPYFTTKLKGKGTGLGLSVVHGIVSNYGGAILAYSEPGRGTLFNAYIPAVKRVARPADPEEPQLPTGSEHILLVDDEPVIIEVGRMMLEMLGYTVTACDASASALAVFEKDPQAIDLVISDVTMPKMTGDRLAAEMLRLRPDLPIVLCTGFSDKVSSKAAAEIGVKAVVMKPLIHKDLALLVRKVLDEARAAR